MAQRGNTVDSKKKGKVEFSDRISRHLKRAREQSILNRIERQKGLDALKIKRQDAVLHYRAHLTQLELEKKETIREI